jgi:hypothetical protein
MIETLLISMLIIAISIVLLCVSILFKKNGRFPNTHVSGNKAMEEKGIYCVMDQDRKARGVNLNQIIEKI